MDENEKANSKQDDTQAQSDHKTEEAVKIQNYSVKALAEETGKTSIGGLRLNGAAHQAAAVPIDEEREKDSLLKLVIALEENMKAMQRAVDEYIEDLQEEIEAKRVERDQGASDLEHFEERYKIDPFPILAEWCSVSS